MIISGQADHMSQKLERTWIGTPTSYGTGEVFSE